MGRVCAVLMHLGSSRGRLVHVPEQKFLAHCVFTRPRPVADCRERQLSCQTMKVVQPVILVGSEVESPMNSVQIEQKSYEMPPREGISIAHFLTVANIERSARYYEKVFGARILSLGDGNAPAYLQLANIWMIVNVGGGPTPDKPTVTLSIPDPNHINSFMNFRVADIQACYELWKSRGAEFITEPIPKYGETRCYIRDPDGYIIEVGQSTDLAYG